MKPPKLLINEIPDRSLQENFRRFQTWMDSDPILQGNWKHFEITLTKNSAKQAVAHNLGFTPTDAWFTYQSGTGTVSFLYSNFDETNFYLGVSGIPANGTVVIRCIVGRVP